MTLDDALQFHFVTRFCSHDARYRSAVHSASDKIAIIPLDENIHSIRSAPWFTHSLTLSLRISRGALCTVSMQTFATTFSMTFSIREQQQHSRFCRNGRSPPRLDPTAGSSNHGDRSSPRLDTITGTNHHDDRSSPRLDTIAGSNQAKAFLVQQYRSHYAFQFFCVSQVEGAAIGVS